MCDKYHTLIGGHGCVSISIATVSYVIIAYCSCFDGYFGNLSLFSKIYQEINSDIQVCSVLSSTYGQTLYNPRWQPTICSCYTPFKYFMGLYRTAIRIAFRWLAHSRPLPLLSRTSISPPAKRHSNGVSLAVR